MSQLETYRNTVIRLRDAIAKLTSDLSKEQAKIAPLQKKINSANDTISRSRSQSIIKSKYREIEQCQKSLADLYKKCADIQKKISNKQKEFAAAEKKMQNEEEKVNKRKISEEKNWLREQEAQYSFIESKVRQQEELQATMQADINYYKAVPEKITVLFMASNPNNTGILKIDEEIRAVQQRLRLSEYRDSIDFESRWAVRSSDILQAINEVNPTIIHFSGHGSNNGDLVLMNPDGSAKYVTKEAILRAISTASDSIRLVVFNTCFSVNQARSVVQNIDAAIGMSDSIHDDTAIIFAAQLYSSIGFGHSLKKAFDQAIASVMLEGIPQDNVPQLFVGKDRDADEIIFVNPKRR